MVEQDSLEDLQLYPAWREAVDKFLEAAFEPGTLVPIEWFYAAFDIAQPGPDTPLKAADRAKVAFLGEFSRMTEALLTEHNIALDNVWGKGYRIVPPPEQSQWAEGEGNADMKRAMRKLGTRLSFVDLAALSEQQRRENADALARFATLTGMIKEVSSRRFIVETDGS